MNAPFQGRPLTGSDVASGTLAQIHFAATWAARMAPPVVDGPDLPILSSAALRPGSASRPDAAFVTADVRGDGPPLGAWLAGAGTNRRNRSRAIAPMIPCIAAPGHFRGPVVPIDGRDSAQGRRAITRRSGPLFEGLEDVGHGAVDPTMSADIRLGPDAMHG